MQRAMLALATATFLAGSVLAADLDGDWVVTGAWENGKAKPPVVGHVLAFKERDFTIKDKDGKLVYGGTYTIDKAQKPATIDFNHDEGVAKGKVWRGIWKTGGNPAAPDMLLICDNAPDPAKPRPKDFTTPTGSGHTLVELMRKK